MENKEKLLVVFGATREDGNTRRLLDDYLKAFAGDREVEILNLNDLSFKGCIYCNACMQKPVCALEDDLSPLYEMVEECNSLVLATPVYFNGVSWLLKKFIDRMQVYFNHEMGWSGKREASLLVAAGAKAYKDQFTASYLEAEITFKALGFPNFTAIQVGNTDAQPYEGGFLRRELIQANKVNRRKEKQWELIE